MPSFELKHSKMDQLPRLLLDYFRSKKEFENKIKEEYIKIKNNRLKIDPVSFNFVEVLIGKDEAYDLSPDERIIFIEEIRKAVHMIEKKRRDMQNHWNEEAKRAGFIGEGEVTKNGVEFSGGGSDLERHLKEN